MEETIQRLRELNESISLPLDLPTEDELVIVEEEILISIPYDFRQYLLSASDVVYGSLEPATAADPKLHTHLPEMCAYAWDIGLPRECIPICSYDGGYACISEDGTIQFWRDDFIEGKQWPDMWRWIAEVWLAR